MSITSRMFVLTDGERLHPLWTKLHAQLEQLLADRRRSNDDAALGAEATAALRGEIKILKAIIAYGNQPPILDGNSDRRTATRAGEIGRM